MARQRGVTLIEMLIVVALIGLMAGVTFPAVTTGIDSLRLSSASDSIVSFLNSAMNRAERRQEVVEVEISPAAGRLTVRASDPGYRRELELPKGIRIQNVLPAIPVNPAMPRRFLFFPAGTVPRIGIELVNRHGVRRIIRVDPVTGAPKIEKVRAK